ncbi:MAG TPA: class I SAM-dependent methyltransferase, partial [Fimbriimonas sp.]|nr:class I SAM-dependent methyltransferase [Fimbriimonas sp.]
MSIGSGLRGLWVNEPETSLDWVKPYYTRAGEYWGPTGYEEGLAERVRTLSRICGAGPLRILELGAGTGEVAAMMVDAGHDVTAVEFSPTRAPNIRVLAEVLRSGRLVAVEEDFYSVSFRGLFDVVCYWDGFGIGSDEDQRRLLRRIASWLEPSG